MDLEISDAAPASPWANRREGKQRRMALVSPWMQGKSLFRTKIINALETLLVPGDRVIVESVQKQADFLSRSLAQVHPKRVHDLQAAISAIARPDHIEIFEQVIANQVNFSFAGPQSIRVAQMLEDGLLNVDLINTYAELSVRMFVDLIPNAVLCCADAADRESNLYTGANTEDTPPMIEAAAFRDGIVIVQVNEIVDTHIVTEEGITYLYKVDGIKERRAAVAGVTKVGLKSTAKQVAALRAKGVVAYPEEILVCAVPMPSARYFSHAA